MSIVSLNVSTLLGATPNTLQQTGAILSQGATSLASGSYSLLSQKSDLTAILAPALSLSSLTWSGGVVTATTANPISGLTTGDTFLTTIGGASPTAYNGTFVATVTGASTFTYALAANPGSETAPGTYTPGNQVELTNAVTDFFAQGTRRGVYVLELGAGDATTGPTALGTFITDNPGIFYMYLVPKSWDGSANFIALARQFVTDSSMTYFWTTTTTNTYAQYAGIKSIQLWVEAPTVSNTEFDAAYAFQVALSYAPSSTNRMTPYAYSYLNGATLYPQLGNNSLLTTLDTANVNYVASAAQGGLSNVMISSGAMQDGEDFSWWYAADYLQINASQTAANIVIQGSNNPLNPLWYSQNGINQLQDGEYRLLTNMAAYALTQAATVRTALDQQTFIDNLDSGLYTAQNVVNAVPYIDYITANPTQYAANTYGGLTIAFWAPQLFKHIVINVLVTNYVAG
jgi:hypothetical protein